MRSVTTSITDRSAAQSTETLHTSGSPLFDLFVLHAEIALAAAVDVGLLDKEKVRQALRVVSGE